MVRAGHGIVFDGGDDCIKEKRGGEETQWGVTFYNYSKQTLHF